MATRLGYPLPIDGLPHCPGSVPIRQVCGASGADCVFHPDLALVASPASLLYIFLPPFYSASINIIDKHFAGTCLNGVVLVSD